MEFVIITLEKESSLDYDLTIRILDKYSIFKEFKCGIIYDIEKDVLSKGVTLKGDIDEIFKLLDGKLILMDRGNENIKKVSDCLKEYGYVFNNSFIELRSLFSNTLGEKFKEIEDLISIFNIDIFKYTKIQDIDIITEGFLSLLKMLDIKNVGELSLRGGITLGRVNEIGIEKSVSIIKDYTFKERSLENFYNEVVVFTGKLLSMKRYEAKKEVEYQGGKFLNRVNKETTVLVIGSNKDNRETTKISRTKTLISYGQNIKVINEDDFLEIIKNVKGDKNKWKK